MEGHSSFVARNFPSTLDVEHVKMHIEIHVSSESLDEGDGTGFEISCFVIRIFFIEAKLHRFFDASCDDRVREAQDFPLEF